ncbi:hypothetical protein MBLNU13_g09686t3 [Cladosporium sp. NU13]
MGISGEAVMATEWVLFALAYTLVGLRIGVRLARRQQRNAVVSDVFLIISALMCLGLIVCDTLTYTLGAMKPETVSASVITADDTAKQLALNKISFASNYFYDTGMYFPKATILALYFELFPNTMPTLRKMLYIVTAFTAASGLATCTLDTFYCPHIPDNWSTEEGACSVFNSLLVLQIDWAMNFSSDLFIFALPFPLIRVLTLRRGQKYGLILTFALGLLTIAVNLARFITIQTGTDWNGVYVWSMAEMSVAIMVVSMPALKYLLKFWKTSKNGSGPDSYYNSGYTEQSMSRRRNQISCSLADETGSDVELNRVVREDVILKTKEISVDSQPAGFEGFSFAGESWDKNSVRQG